MTIKPSIKKIAPANQLALSAKIRRDTATVAANRHLRAYVMSKNPLHIAEAWAQIRNAKVIPDENMFKAIDCLVDSVLNRVAATERPAKNTVRDMDIYRLVQLLKKDGAKDPHDMVAKVHGMTVKNLRTICSRVEKAINNPYERPRAFVKK